MILSSMRAAARQPVLSVAMASFCLVATSAQAKVEEVAYFMPEMGVTAGELIAWDDGTMRARLTDRTGVRNGSYTDNGVQRVITLDVPITYFFFILDSCGLDATVRSDTGTFVYRPVQGSVRKGRTESATVTTETVLDGCDAGQVTVIGSVDDPGTRMSHLAMKKRPAMSDLLPGLRLAGFSRDEQIAFEELNPTLDIGHFLAGGQMQFEASGKTVSTSLNRQGWLVYGVKGVKRAYTRLEVDDETGHEVWFAADFADGKPLWVAEVDMVKVQDGASFGTRREAARHWVGSFALSDPYGYDLYREGSGYYFSEGASGVSLTPLTWNLPGDIRIVRDSAGVYRVRHWTPLARNGDVQWVMEREVNTYDDGFVGYINPRVNYYTDGGRAVPRLQAVSGAGAPSAMAAQAASKGPVRGHAPALRSLQP